LQIANFKLPIEEPDVSDSSTIQELWDAEKVAREKHRQLCIQCDEADTAREAAKKALAAAVGLDAWIIEDSEMGVLLLRQHNGWVNSSPVKYGTHPVAAPAASQASPSATPGQASPEPQAFTPEAGQ
jgi:hypothetical protein